MDTVAQTTQWRLAAKGTDGQSIYYSPKSKERYGDIVKVWTKHDLSPTTQKYGILLQEFNCNKKELRVLSLTDYKDGISLNTFSEPSEWKIIVPDSTGEALYNIVCLNKEDEEFYSDVDKASKLFFANDFSKAREIFLELFELSPENTLVLNYLADIYQKTGQKAQENQYRQKAITILQAKIRLANCDYSDYESLANTFKYSGERERAIATLQEGIKKFPTEASLYENLSDIYKESGNYEKALEQLRTIENLTSNNFRKSTILNKIAWLYVDMKQFANARASWRKAFELHKFDAWYKLCMIASYTDDAKEALLVINQAYSYADSDVLQPNRSLLARTKGEILIKLKRFDEAIETYQAALVYESDSLLIFDLGKAYLKIGRKTLARQQYEKLLTLDPKLAAELIKLINKKN